MNFNKKDVFVGLLIIAVLIAGFLIYKKVRLPKPALEKVTPASYEFKQNFEDDFKIEIPENTNAIELKDVNGGDSRGIATESEILVDANSPDNNHFYQSWVERGGELFSLGKLEGAKGGWLLKFDSNIVTSSSKIIVSLETKLDNILEKKILEGSF